MFDSVIDVESVIDVDVVRHKPPLFLLYKCGRCVQSPYSARSASFLAPSSTALHHYHDYHQPDTTFKTTAMSLTSLKTWFYRASPKNAKAGAPLVCHICAPECCTTKINSEQLISSSN